MKIRLVILALCFVAGGRLTDAVLFKSTADPDYNTTAPTGGLTDSGWQYQGQWGNFLGTPIAPTFFITAQHIGGTNGQEFVLNGFTYHAVTNYDDLYSDLRVWKVAETFPAYASLYTNQDEVGKHCIVFGRGTQRGAPIIIGGKTNGWMWGAADEIKRWGENDVAAIIEGTPSQGDLLRATFDRGAGSNECHLSVGDSGGAMIIQDDSNVWKLAGIHYAVDGPFSNAVDGTTFQAALMDRGGLYEQSGTNWIFYLNTGQDKPSGFYSTRISSHIAWINSVINLEVGTDLRITALTVVENDAQISFDTTSNRLYRVEYRDDLMTGTWLTLTNQVPGTGGVVSVIDPGAAGLPKRFYRLGLMP
jgi:hypothetical protein